MLAWMMQKLEPPLFETEEQNYIAAILRVILISLLVVVGLITSFNLVAGNLSAVFISGLAFTAMLFSLWLLIQGHLTASSVILPFIGLSTITLAILNGHGIYDIAVIAYPAVIVLAGLLFGRRGTIFIAALCFLALSGVYVAQVNGMVAESPMSEIVRVDNLINQGLTISVITVLLHLMVGNLTDSLAKVRSNEQTLSRNNRKLLEIRTSLEAEIAERKQAEAALTVARDQALMASRLKTELLAKVSHELRTPLNAIMGYSEMLYEGLFGPVAETQRKPLHEVIESTYYLAKIVDELLDQSKLEAGKLSLNISRFSPADIINETQSKMQVLARTKDLKLSTMVSPEIPAFLDGDPVRLQQIMVNLIGNAIKFTPKGSVAVRLFCPDESHWAICVSDTGPGIPTHVQSHIFEPFGQVDGSMTREHSGTGLGLSIVKQLATLMGGDVSLQSEPGQGSAFTVTLPLTYASNHTVLNETSPEGRS